MDDLLKDAIADAKAVRETAIANAKLALEEAFTPKLQNMLSQKIQNEIELDEEEMDEERDDEVDEERDDEKDEAMHGKMRRDGDEEMDEERDDDPEEGKMRRDGDEMEEERDDEKDEGAHEEDEMEEGEHEDDDMEEDLDLEAIIKELEAEINEEDEEERNEGEERDDKDEVKEGEHEDDEDKDDIDENDVSSGIGKSDNAHDKKSGASTDIGKANKAKHESVDEDFDLDSILEALKDEEVTEGEEEVDEVAELRAELDETREAVKFMRDKLNEVNLLNAKLLFTNKLFRAYGLNNEQKMKVVETFDRASNLREVKLVYSTLAESFGGAKKNEIQESKGSASKAVASTKSEKQGEVITEGNTMRDRFKKLANII